MTIAEAKELKRGDILYLRDFPNDNPETVRFVRLNPESELAIIQRKEKFVKGGFGQTGLCCLLSKLSTQ